MSDRFENSRNKLNDIDALDARMAQALQEERKRQRARDKKRRQKATQRKMILVLVVIVAAVCLCFGLAKLLHSDVFEDKAEFTEFADTMFEADGVCPETDVDEREYHFSEKTSYAVKRGGFINKNTKKYLEGKIDTIIKEQTKSKNPPMALLIDAAAYKAENGTISTVVHYSTYNADGRHMKRETASVDTHMFNGKTGVGVDPLQVMTVNYKTKAQDYASEYFSKTYKDKELTENWERYTTSGDKNFNQFVITEDEVAFFFDDGTVLQEGEGTPVMSIPDKIIGSTIRPKILERYIDKNKPMVALTYDDGPYAETENRILDVLEENGCVATFFYLGNRIKDDHKPGRRAVKIGCELGNHSWSHPAMSQLDNKEIISEINKTNAVIYRYCGVEPVVARPPYGDYNDKVLKKTGMAQIMWSLDTLDWKTRDAESTFNEIKEAKDLDGAIVLMHSIYDSTADATAEIIPWLKENGYQTVTVSELIKYKTGKPPQAGKVYENVK